MAFQTDHTGVRHNENSGLWAVSRRTPQWDAWTGWLHVEFGYRLVPDHWTVPTQWPPTTQRGADTFAQWLSDIRDQPFGTDKTGCNPTPVPRHPKPWHGELR